MTPQLGSLRCKMLLQTSCTSVQLRGVGLRLMVMMTKQTMDVEMMSAGVFHRLQYARYNLLTG